jgi:hypothetical protein
MKKILLLVLTCSLLCSCEETEAEQSAKKLFKLELYDGSGRLVRTVEATKVTVYLEGIIKFQLANGHESYWRGNFFAEETK